MNEPVGDDDFFAVQVVDDLDDDRAILVVGDRKIAVEFGDLVELVDLVEKRKPIEVRLSQTTHDRLVAELARQGIYPNRLQ